MKFAFVIFKFFPFGGAQRDMLRIARECLKLGHTVHIYTLSWQGPSPEPGISYEILPASGWMNYQRYRDFIMQVRQKIREVRYDLVVGFNRMPGLDAYFAADPCFIEQAYNNRPWWYRWSSRYHFFAECEKQVFAENGGCEILLLAPNEKTVFQHWYQTPEARFHLMPPVLAPERFVLGDRAQIRADVRAEFGFPEDSHILLLVGSGFKTKGLDRVLEGLLFLPDDLRGKTCLVAVGQDNPDDFNHMAKKLRLEGQVVICKGRDDIPRLMQGADLLVHPARRELAGHVLIEALACGLPVLTTDVCGYSFHVNAAGGGMVLPSPFTQEAFNLALRDMLRAGPEPWRAQGLAYAQAILSANIGDAEARLLESFARRQKVAA